MPFNMFPYSNLHELNLDWILGIVKTMAAAVEAAAGTVESYAARLTQVETNVQTITPAATGAVRHDVSQSLDTGNRRRAATNIHAVSYDSTVLTNGEKSQARTNIGAADAATVTALAENVTTLENSRVSYAAAQTLSSGQQAQARSNIGAAAASAIPDVSDVLRYSSQSLTDGQKSQARTNIGAAATSAIPDVSDVLRYSSQSLTDGQKSQARTNIGAAATSAIPDVSDVLRYSSQSLTDGQKSQARTNIGAAATSAIPDVSDVLRYSSQSLTDGQKTQARSNIGAASSADIPDEAVLVGVGPDELGTGYESDMTLTEILAAVAEDRVVMLRLEPIGDTNAYYGMITTNSTTVSANIIIMQAPGSAMASRVYNVNISNSGGSDVITVSYNDFRTAQDCSISDAGKIWTVGSNGRPSWQDPAGPLVVTFSGLTESSDAACDKTRAQIAAAFPNIIAKWTDGQNVFILPSMSLWYGDNYFSYHNESEHVSLSCYIDSENTVNIDASGVY